MPFPVATAADAETSRRFLEIRLALVSGDYDPGYWTFWVDAPGAVPADPVPIQVRATNADSGRSNFDIECLAGGGQFSAARWKRRHPRCGGESVVRECPTRLVVSVRTDVSTSRNPRTCWRKSPGRSRLKFQQLPVRAGTSVMQPSPNTLRGAETNFYAEAAEQTFAVDMLGQRVAITAKPVQYSWSYGDGAGLGPETAAGGPLPTGPLGRKDPDQPCLRTDR